MHQVYLDTDYCKGTEECGICVWCCPTEVFEPSKQLNSRGALPPAIARLADCVGCENCMIFCPDLVIAVVKDPHAAERVVR